MSGPITSEQRNDANPDGAFDWQTILQDKCRTASITDIARELGYSRTTISQVLSGTYNGGTDRIAARVLACFSEYVTCPYLERVINQATCDDHQSRAMPTSDPAALRHWMACRSGCRFSYHSIEDDKGHG